MDNQKQEYYQKVMDIQVRKLKKLLEKYDEMEENLFHELMIQLIDQVPEELHNHLFVKFTYMLGNKLKIPRKIITKELIKN